MLGDNFMTHDPSNLFYICICGEKRLTYLPRPTEHWKMGLKGLKLKLNQVVSGKPKGHARNPKTFPEKFLPDFLEKMVSQNPNTEALTLLNAQMAKRVTENHFRPTTTLIPV